MNAPLPPEQHRPSARGELSLSTHWSAMRDAGAAVALLAGVDAGKPGAAERNFAAAIADAGGWRLELARERLVDMGALLQPGLAALLAVKARGRDAAAPARALWSEYRVARDALLALAPEAGAMGPRRSA